MSRYREFVFDPTKPALAVIRAGLDDAQARGHWHTFNCLKKAKMMFDENSDARRGKSKSEFLFSVVAMLNEKIQKNSRHADTVSVLSEVAEKIRIIAQLA